MKIIYLHYPYDKTIIPDDKVVLALGFFDGVHRGHQSVIRTAKDIANQNQIKLAAMTFNHHPSVVFDQRTNSPENSLSYITSVSRKAKLMEDLGVNILYVADFTSSFAKQSANQFIDNYIVGLNAETVVAGFDYTFGPIDKANMDILPTLAQGRFDVVKVEKLKVDGEKASSSRIRSLITIGNIDEANTLLGYPFETHGIVVHGEARGRTLGYPTANIISSENQVVLGIGIYVVEIKIGAEWHQGMASVGKNVTFGKNRKVTTEINILDFKREIYGEEVDIKWYNRIRGEEMFTSAEELVDQLQRDEVATRSFFKKI